MNTNAAIQLERAITHLIVTDNEHIASYARLLDKRMFLEPVNHQFITSAADLLSEGNMSRLNLIERLEQEGVKNPNENYTLQAAAITSSSRFATHYAAWIEHARLKFIENCDLEFAGATPTAADLIFKRTQCLELVRAIGVPDEGVTMRTAAEGAVDWLKHLRSVQGKSIVSTGYPEIDRNIIGLMPGTLTTLAARPGVGKTTLAALWALNAQESAPVLFNSLEMSPSRLSVKITALSNGTNSMDYERSFEATDLKFNETADALMGRSDLNIRFFEQQDPWALESSIIMLKPSLVIWDFLQITATPGKFASRRSEFIGEVARSLQIIAKRRNVPIVVLSQLNRDGDGGQASLANLKDSGVIEEASDNVLFLERPQMGEPGADSLRAILSIKKARSGFPGAQVELMMNPKTGSFEYWNTIAAAQMLHEVESR